MVPNGNRPRFRSKPYDFTVAGELLTTVLSFDGGRRVSAFVPASPPTAIVFAGDGELITSWAPGLDDDPPVLVVGVHRAADETIRLHDYSPGFDPERFAAHEDFFVHDVWSWVTTEFGIDLPPARTAIHGVSAGAELALALGLRHPEVVGTILCASPGAGFRPDGTLPAQLPRSSLVAGADEPFFADNAWRWADALAAAGGEVVRFERPGDHGGPFWREEFPLMVRWAFG